MKAKACHHDAVMPAVGPSLGPSALADLAVATFHRGIKIEGLAKYIVAAPSMQENQPMSGETLNVHLRQSFELAGEPVQ